MNGTRKRVRLTRNWMNINKKKLYTIIIIIIIKVGRLVWFIRFVFSGGGGGTWVVSWWSNRSDRTSRDTWHMNEFNHE